MLNIGVAGASAAGIGGLAARRYRGFLRWPGRAQLPLKSRIFTEPLTAASQVTWSVAADGQGPALVAHNPTPYHVTFSKISLGAGQAALATDAGMVAPLSTLRLPLADAAKLPPAGTVVAYTTINDFGAAVANQGTLTP